MIFVHGVDRVVTPGCLKDKMRFEKDRSQLGYRAQMRAQHPVFVASNSTHCSGRTKEDEMNVDFGEYPLTGPRLQYMDRRRSMVWVLRAKMFPHRERDVRTSLTACC